MSKPLPGWAKEPILPYCSSDLERELDVALSHIESVEMPIKTLWNPMECPLVALPYLAWALKVEKWDASWPERVKRQFVADSLDLHRVRGTRPAVEMALQSMDVRCEIVEWFEDQSQKMEAGTFRVTAHVGEDMGDGPELIRALREVVDSAKPASRPYTLSLQGMLRAHYGVVAAVRVVQAKLLRLRS